jgi:WD40 repeat protein
MAANNPYLGPASFGERDRDRFYGRDEEARQLSYLLIARQAVLLYAQSGAGKTSLLQAKVIPDLRASGEMRVLPISRVSGPATGANVYVANALAGLKLEGDTLPAALAPLFAEAGGDDEDEPPTLLILDQFEEVFTFHRELADQRQAFFEQLRASLEAHPKLGLLFSMREDFLADMDSFAAYLPDRLRTRMRMERLSDTQAEEAIARPAAEAGKPFEPGVARALVDDLRQLRVVRRVASGDEADGRAMGKYVEPVQLQIVCSQLWSKLPDGAAAITAEQVRELANVDDALTGFYHDCLEAVVAALPDVRERELREWFGRRLITPAGTRGMVFQGESETEGLPNAAVEVLAGKYIVRADQRTGGIWYELAHDRLVEPILADNLEWRARYKNPVADALQRSPDTPMTGSALAAAIKFERENPGELSPEERRYLDNSIETATRNRRRRNIGLATAAGVMLALTGLTLWALGAQSRARNVIERNMAERPWNAYRQGNYVDAVRYALAGMATTRGNARSYADAADALAASLANLTRSRALIGHTDGVTDVAFSPDGKRVLTASRDFTARVWDTGAGGLIATLKGHTDVVNSAVFSPDGGRIVTASNDMTARIWDARTGHVVAVLQHPAQVSDAAFSPDGKRVVTASNDKAARLWDAATGRMTSILQGHTDQLSSAAFSPDGGRIVTASYDQTARVWDVGSGRTLTILQGHTGGLNAATFSPDGRLIVTAAQDTTARVWDAASGRTVATLPRHAASVASAVFSPDGRRIVTGSDDQSARIWDAASGREIKAFRAHADTVTRAVFSPDGARIATSSLDGTARLWDTVSPTDVRTLTGHADWVRGAAFSPDGRRIVTASQDHTARVWDAATGREIVAPLTHADAVWSAAFSPDGRRIVTGSWDHTARVWDAGDGRGLVTIQQDQAVPSASFSPDGQRVATASLDGVAALWDTASGRPMRTILVRHAIFGASFSPDGRRIVTPSLDATARVWDLASGAVVLTLRGKKDLYSAAYSPDGKRIVAASVDGTARVWDASSGRDLMTVRGTEAFFSAVFSPDGRRIVTASQDGAARVWDAASGREVGTLLGHTGPVLGAAFSPDGRRIVTASQDKTARVWDVHLLTATPDAVRREACTWLLLPRAGSRTFTPSELRKDAVVAEIWLANGRTVDTDLCAGVKGASPMTKPDQEAARVQK